MNHQQPARVVWTAILKRSSSLPEEDTKIEAPSLDAAAKAFVWWRAARGVDQFVSIRFEELEIRNDVVVVPLHEHFSDRRLGDVTHEMRTRGSPRIHAFHDPYTGAWMSKEGTHRLRAALGLGLRPVMVWTPWWRGLAALERARHAIARRGHQFAAVGTETGRSATMYGQNG